ncbi:hypothetical protein DRQ19_02250 [bacterium]|nr:MAG: hypothetical protein DRQ19_02250 [bacterium]
MTVFYVLMVFMIIGAIVAVETKNMLSAVIAVGAVGVGASVIFLFLRAPDIAITQVIVEVLSLIILIRVTIRADNYAIERRQDNFANIVGLVFVGLFLVFAFWAYKGLPEFGNPLMRVSSSYLREGTRETGAANIVASVILDYRAYDTLGEAIVLFTSILGAFVILRPKGRKHIGEEDKGSFGIIEDKEIKE